MANISEFSEFLRKSNLESAAYAMHKSRKSILFIDYCRVRDKYDFLQELAQSLVPYNLFVIDGASLKDGASFENITFIAPPPEVYYLKKLQISAASTWSKELKQSGFDAMAELFKLHVAQVNEYVDSNIVQNCIQTAYLFTLTAIRMLRPNLVMIWNAFHPLSQAAEAASRLSDVPVGYTEFGVLPGSMNVDFTGQMGESWVAQNGAAFNALPIEPEDMDNARLALDLFYETGLNRRKQPDYGVDDLKARVQTMAAGRPVVLFAGHNDLASGMFPYSEHAREYHSPIFSSSGEGARALIDISKENGWFLLYKPHPFYQKDGSEETPAHVLRVGDVNINECVDIADVTCTILSQVSYVARIRKKPTVMLGYNQMRDKGIAYEVQSIDAIAPAIARALERGVTEEQETAWVEHTARLLRYYLYRWNHQEGSIHWQEPAILASRLKNMIDSNTFCDFGNSAALIPTYSPNFG